MQQQDEGSLALRDAMKADSTGAYILVLPGLGDFRHRENLPPRRCGSRYVSAATRSDQALSAISFCAIQPRTTSLNSRARIRSSPKRIGNDRGSISMASRPPPPSPIPPSTREPPSPPLPPRTPPFYPVPISPPPTPPA